ncbi:hypothetical protein [Mesonia sp.]|uniref:hypothetical protein n=1 Tax=Mesonia sp. TaxID=1960830 RepID=UPI003F966C08
MSAKNNHSSKKSFEKGQAKDKDFKRYSTQLKTIFHYLQNHTATASMIAMATDIPQKSICRYKRSLEKEGLLYEVEKKLCKATNFRAWYLTTNPELFSKVEPQKACK